MKRYIIDPSKRKPVRIGGTPLGRFARNGSLLICGIVATLMVVLDTEERRARIREKFKETEDMKNRNAMYSSTTMYHATLSMFAKHGRAKNELPETNIDEPERSSCITIDQLNG